MEGGIGAPQEVEISRKAVDESQQSNAGTDVADVGQEAVSHGPAADPGPQSDTDIEDPGKDGHSHWRRARRDLANEFSLEGDVKQGRRAA